MGLNLFERALARGEPIVLDGGLATELESRGHDIGSALWSAGLLHSNPSAIVEAHRAFLEAGAEIIISASYQASREGLMTLGLTGREADALIVTSVELADRARREYVDAHRDWKVMPVVAASIGPFGAAMHDGSEYTGNYGVDEKELREFHEPRLTLLDRSGADVLACETIPSLPEARVLHDLLMRARLPAWMSFSCKDEKHISDGSEMRQAAALFREHPRVLAIGVNCTAPQLVESLITEIRRAAPGKAIVAYPNSGETYEVSSNSWYGRASEIRCPDEAGAWVRAGARIIGGCCRVGPAQIAALRKLFESGY